MYPLPKQVYKHYKGGTYEVVSMATHSETGEKLVVYKSLNFGSVYVSLKCGRTKINLQFKKGSLVQSYGKANTPVKEKFMEAIKILTSRMEKFDELYGIKEKYDILTN